MREIKALETHAYGCSFRSRLEARWATVLNALGIAWEYEPEGFSLPSGNYLPDFYLPNVLRNPAFLVGSCETHPAGAYLEVKPTRRDPRAETLLCELAEHTSQECLLAGPLTQEPYGLWCPDTYATDDVVWFLPHGQKDKDLWWDPEGPDYTYAHDPERPGALAAAWNAGRAFRHDDPRTHVKLRKTG